MKSLTKSILSFLVFCLLLSPVAFSQTQEKGNISGTVVDQEGTILPGATITLKGEKLLQKAISMVANERGAFRFLNLLPACISWKFRCPDSIHWSFPISPSAWGKQHRSWQN